MMQAAPQKLIHPALEAVQLSSLKNDPSLLMSMCPFPFFLERVDSYKKQDIGSSKLNRQPQAGVSHYIENLPHGKRLSSNRDEKRQFYAARTIQNFFLRIMRLAEEKQQALKNRLREIEQEKQRELDLIANRKEAEKLSLLSAMEGKPGDDYESPFLEGNKKATKEITQEIVALKKENAYLFKRCIELQKINKDLNQERKQRKEKIKSIKRDSRKLSKMIQKRNVALCRHQSQLGETKLNLRDASDRLESCRITNKQIRASMKDIVHLVEECAPDNADKWDLVDKLYELQRCTHWRRNQTKALAEFCGQGRFRPQGPHTSTSKRDFHQIPPPTSMMFLPKESHSMGRNEAHRTERIGHSSTNKFH